MNKTKKCQRSESITSNKSLSSLSDTAVKAGRKAKQVALKTVKSLTALLKPRKHRVVPDSKPDDPITSHVNFNLSCIGDAEPEKVDEGNVESTSLTHTSSIMDVDALLS